MRKSSKLTESDNTTGSGASEIDEVIEPKDLIRQGLRVLKDQIQKIEDDADGDGVLSPRMAKMLTDYIKTAIQIERDVKDLGDLSAERLRNMSPEEIKTQAYKIIEEFGLNLNKGNL